jgi:hypothetical protein
MSFFGGVWTLTAELKKKIRKRRKEEGKCRKRKRRKDTRCKSRDSIFMSPAFFRNLSFQWSSKAEYLTTRNLLQSNIWRDGQNQFVNDLFTLYLEVDSLLYFVCFGRDSPQWVMAFSFTRFLDITQRRTTVGRTPLEEWSARRRDLYLTTHNTHNRQTSMPLVGFEPTISAGERPQT